MLTPCPTFREIVRAFCLSLHSRSRLDDLFVLATLKYSDTAEELWLAQRAAFAGLPDQTAAAVVYAADQHRKAVAWYDQIKAERERRDLEAERRFLSGPYR